MLHTIETNLELHNKMNVKKSFIPKKIRNAYFDNYASGTLKKFKTLSNSTQYTCET